MMPRIVARTSAGTVLIKVFRDDGTQVRQRLSLPTATSSGEPWSRDDTELALDRSLSNLEAARALGRTAYAVRSKRRDVARAERKENR